MPDAIHIREMHKEDAQAVLEVHRDAVHTIASADYPPEIINQWSSSIIDETRIEGFLKNPDNEIRIVAEMGGKIVGFGMIVIPRNELRACYVSPAATRYGVGTRLVQELEKIAIEAGLDYLQMDSSLTAEKFYQHNGYKSLKRGKHIMRNGMEMDSVKMHKKLSK